MSRKPGIGALSAPDLAAALQSRFGEFMLTEEGDVPYSLSQAGKSFPLGRYLREQIRKLVDQEEWIDPYTGEIKSAPKEKQIQVYKQEMRLMFEANKLNEKASPDSKVSLKHFVKETNAQKIRNLETRHNLQKKEKKL